MTARWLEWLKSRNRRRSEGLLAELEALLAVGVAEGKEDAGVNRLFAGAGCEDYWPDWGSLFGGSVRWHLALSVC